ncbi:MAG: hypothetical protein EXR28_07580 [Betaproteobacteria bacterium]|nr:hypothetical protein [Betaproteobacteria bacterium]
MKNANPGKLNTGMRRIAVASALAMAMLAGGAQAQQGPRYGLAPAEAPKPAVVPPLRPLVVIRSHPVYYPAYSPHSPSSSGNSSPRSTSPVQGPYLVGPGQWVPEGAQMDVLALQSAQEFTRATPAAASAHWDWKRTSLGELVEMSRRNKASRAAD